MSQIIGADHQFHDTEFAQGWADRFVPTPPRIELFDAIIDRLRRHTLPSRHLVELGIGPGYLAERLLASLPDVSYEGVDFSSAMLEIAARRLAEFKGRLTLTQADLTAPGWIDQLRRPFGAIISTWALHDLGSEAAIDAVYRHAYRVLPGGGILLNGDFVKPVKSAFEYEAGRLTIDRHLALLAAAGFSEPRCLVYLEPDVEHPTAANNYACFEARRD